MLEGVRPVLRGLSAPRSSAAGLCVFAETGPPGVVSRTTACLRSPVLTGRRGTVT